MKYETDRWTQLTTEQAEFFMGQVTAAAQIVMSPTAHEAGIVPLTGMRYRSQVNSAEYGVMQWTDPTQPDTSCLLIASNSYGVNGKSFMRVTESPGNYAMEGVTLDGGTNYGGNWYGEQMVSRPELPNEPNRASMGIQFFATGEQVARERRQTPFNWSDSPMGAKANLVGIESDTTARLFRSLSSLGANLAIGGAMIEQQAFSCPAYDLARTLLKMKLSDVVTSNGAAGSVVLRPDGKVGGVAYESENGLVAIRQLQTFPATIALTTANRPLPDDNAFFAEQYYIQASSLTVDVMTLPPQLYAPMFITGVLTVKDAALLQPASGNKALTLPPGALNPDGQRSLEQTIIRLIGERGNQPVTT